MKIAINLATEKDLAQIVKMGNEIWNAHYPAIVGQAQVDYMLNKWYSLSALTEQFNAGQQFYIIINEGNQQQLGYIAVTPSDSDKSLFLNKFYVYPQKQNTGLGTQVFHWLINTFDDINLIKLQVNRLNYKSINFYFKLGFKIETAFNFDIDNGYFMEDYVMAWKRVDSSE